MSWGSIYLLSERAIKIYCLLVGAVFLAISAWVWSQGELQANDSRALILVPLLSAIVLIVGAVALRKEALRTLVLAWFIGAPALLWAVSAVGCRAGWFTQSWCQ
jgi:hypothetical protein